MAKGLNRVVRPLAKGAALVVLGTAMQGMLLNPSLPPRPDSGGSCGGREKAGNAAHAALQEATYKRLAEAQELVDLKDYAGADQVLVDLLARRGLNAYEIASAYNMRAFVAFSNEDYPGAIAAYEGVLSQSRKFRKHWSNPRSMP